MKVLGDAGDPLHVEAAPSLALDVQPGTVLDLDAVYAAHAPFIARVLARLLGNGPHVDDLVQETFIVAFRKQATFDGTCAVRTWLYGIAARLAMRHRRGVGRWLRAIGAMSRDPEPAPEPMPDRGVERERAAAVVRQILDQMPLQQREVFVLYELEELEGAEIAELLGIPVNTVWTRLHHARKRFTDRARKHIGRDDHA